MKFRIAALSLCAFALSMSAPSAQAQNLNLLGRRAHRQRKCVQRERGDSEFHVTS